ncbi:hypothetical protein Tco_1285411 [Tanacetum coccineum]
MATRLVSCERMEEAANSTRMENQILVQFDRERAANRADARGLMNNLKRAPKWDVEKPSNLNETVSEARCDAHDKTVFMTSLFCRLLP